MASIYSRIE